MYRALQCILANLFRNPFKPADVHKKCNLKVYDFVLPTTAIHFLNAKKTCIEMFGMYSRVCLDRQVRTYYTIH